MFIISFELASVESDTLEYSDEPADALKVEDIFEANNEELNYDKLMIRQLQIFEQI